MTNSRLAARRAASSWGVHMISFETTALLVTWVAIALLGLAMAGLVRQVHALTSGTQQSGARELGLPAGTAAPELGRLSPDADKPTALLFLDEGCGSCTAVLDEVRAIVARDDKATPVAFRVIFPGPATSAGEPGGKVSVFTNADDLFVTYRVPAAPLAVLVDPAGRIQRYAPLGSAAALHQLVMDNAGALESSIPGGAS
jgi:hypothetical protein